MTALQDHLENRVSYNMEYCLRKKDGTYCWINSKGQAIWDENGRAIRMAGSITDISDRTNNHGYYDAWNGWQNRHSYIL